MSILNMPSDGLFNVLIVLCRALVRFGPENREDLLKSCGSELAAIDPRHLHQSLNRWTELGLFSIDDGLVAIREPHCSQLGKNADFAERQLAHIARAIGLAPENNERFWESEENKSADLSRGVSWILAQDIYAMDTGSHTKVAAIEREQVAASVGAPEIRQRLYWMGHSALGRVRPLVRIPGEGTPAEVEPRGPSLPDGWPTPVASDGGARPPDPKRGPAPGLEMAAKLTTAARLTASGEMLTGSDAGMTLEVGAQLSQAHCRWLMGCPVQREHSAPNYSDWQRWQDWIGTLSPAQRLSVAKASKDTATP